MSIELNKYINTFQSKVLELTNNKSNTKLNLDLTNHKTSVFMGRKEWELFRLKYNLDLVDKYNLSVNIIFPKNTFSINSSFFLGFFGPSVIYYGSKEKFLEKYSFVNLNDDLLNDVNRGIKRALMEVVYD